MSLLTRVRSHARLRADTRAWRLLHGSFASLHHERAMELDDLRSYVPGDSPRDIDWKATARTGSTLVRRSMAARQHQVWLVVDTGRSMAAHLSHGVSKRDVAVVAAGVVADVATRQGDVVGLVHGDRTGASTIAPGRGDAHVERLLRRVHDSTTTSAPPTSPSVTWAHASRAAARRGICVLISDDHHLTDVHADLLRRLRARHTVIHLTVGDLLLGDELRSTDCIDVRDHRTLPRYLRDDPVLAAELRDRTESSRAATSRLLDRCGVRHGLLTGPDRVVTDVLGVISGGVRAH